MDECNRIRWAYMKSFFINLGTWVGLPSIVLLVISFMGIKLKISDTDLLQHLSVYAPYLLMFGFFWVGLKTTEQTILKDREKAAENFYSINSSACIDRAFRVFYHLFNEGKSKYQTNDAQRQNWDRRVIEALRKYCHASNLSLYLLNTGRVDHTKPITPIIVGDFEAALSHIEDLLRSNFEHAILPGAG